MNLARTQLPMTNYTIFLQEACVWSIQKSDHSLLCKIKSANCVFSFFFEDITHTMCGKFHFVDLAGSERAHRTGNVGDRFKGINDTRFKMFQSTIKNIFVFPNPTSQNIVGRYVPFFFSLKYMVYDSCRKIQEKTVIKRGKDNQNFQVGIIFIWVG